MSMFVLYNADEGRVATGFLSGKEFLYRKSRAGLPGTQWTHVAAQPGQELRQGTLLLYSQSSGAVATMLIDGHDGSARIVSSGDEFTWDLVARTKSSVLFYSRAGAGATGRVLFGKYQRLKFFDFGSFATDWSAIAATEDAFVFYRRDGHVIIGAVGDDGAFRQTAGAIKVLPDCSHVVGCGNDVVCFSSKTGMAELGAVGAGRYALKRRAQLISMTAGTLKHLAVPTHIASINTHLLLYNALDGGTTFASIDGSRLRITRARQRELEPSWSAIAGVPITTVA